MSLNNELIVDLRTKKLFVEGSIPGAINIPMDSIDQLYTLPMDRRVCVLCQAGEISEEVAEFMCDAGYDAYSYEGGYRRYLEEAADEQEVRVIYADNASTTAMSQGAIDAYVEALQYYGNPSTLHRQGRKAAAFLAGHRESVAKAFHCLSEEIVFTSGGSESDNQALITAAKKMAAQGKNHIISDTIEHHAILHTLEELEGQGFQVTLLQPDAYGIISPQQVKDAITDQTGLVSIMYANNEIGTVQPIREIGKICHDAGALMHTDAVQAAGHIPINVNADNIDLMSVSAHKFHGPRGVGLLYIRKGLDLQGLILGGGQESGLRAGTENVAGIAGMAAALDEAVSNMADNNEVLVERRNKLIDAILQLPGVLLNGHPEKRLPGNVNVSFTDYTGESLLHKLDARGICVSAGSACSASDAEPSHVLKAIGRTREEAQGSIRITIDKTNTEEEIDIIIRELRQIISG